MPRGIRAALSIAELERMLATQRSAVNRLTKKRTVIRRKLDTIDRDIAKLGASGAGRARNEVSLLVAIETALKKKGQMQVGEIMDAVLASGYLSKSPNFRGIVNQTLIKDSRFKSAARGIYELKK
jgi:hypothetical protein